MIWVADENVDRQIVEALRTLGHSVTFVAESWPGLDDDRVLDETARRSATLITADKDFGELVYRLRRVSNGVLLIRLPGLDVRERAARVVEAVSRHGAEMLGAFSVLNATGLRIRRTP